ncbi:hypothetical protein ACP4OV_018013 [Aristida adscensionis]
MASLAADAAASEPVDSSGSGAVQFFLRNIDSRTSVIRPRREDTLDAVLDRLGYAAAPKGELRVVHAGRELRRDAAIGELGLPRDATLHVTCRILSTPHADAWDRASEIAGVASRFVKLHPPAAAAPPSLQTLVRQFLDAARAAHQRTSPSALGPVATAEHVDIFLRSGAPAALAELYLSGDQRRRAEAELAIRCFLSPDPEGAPGAVKVWTAPVLMQLCQSIAAGPRWMDDDPLYADLRSTLAAVLSLPGWTPPSSPDVPRDWVCAQLTRIAEEMANAVAKEIAGEHWRSTPRSFAEFKTFSSVLRQLVRELDTEKLRRRPWMTVLTDTLVSLVIAVDHCMARFEKRPTPPPPPPKWSFWRRRAAPRSAPPKWTSSLHSAVWAVLSELDAWSSLGAWPELRLALRATLAAHTPAATALVVGAGREQRQNIRWIAGHKSVLASEARRHLAMALLPELVTRGGAPPPAHRLTIDRSQLLPESFACIASSTHEELRRCLCVEFMNEPAAGPGVLREWFCLVFQELFNPRLVLFSACPQDRRRFFLNPASVVDPLHQQYFKFAGQMIALALMRRMHVGVFLDRTLFLQLAGRSITLDDIADADPSLHASCKNILEMDPSLVDSNVLGLTFVREADMLGSRTATELFPGGKDIAVTSENRRKYIDLLIQECFVKCTSSQLAHFAEGFSSILGGWYLKEEFFECLDADDFDQMLGDTKDTVDLKDWRAHTDYRDYGAKSRQINWFWKAVESMTVEQQRRLLFFWTSVKYLPSEGFRGLSSRLLIYRASVSRDHLPTSRTCFYTLILPAYTSFSMMQSRLQMIVQEHLSCGYGEG